MRAIRFHELGGPEVLRLEDIPVPEPAANEVLVAVAAAGVNFADTRRRLGTYLEPSELPFVLGAEIAGTVVRVGSEVDRWRPGDRVMGLVNSGGYAEYVATRASQLFPIPDVMSFETAAAFPLQGLTAYHILRTSGRLQPGESVLVHSAAGGVGSLAVQLAKVFGAGTVYATASTEEKLTLARELGADVTINYTAQAFDAPILARQKQDGKRGVDVILDAVGGDGFRQNFTCLASFGRIVLYGVASGSIPQFNPVQLMRKCQEVSGFYLPGVLARPDLLTSSMQELGELLAASRLKILVGSTFPLEDAAEAHRALEGRKTTGKGVLKVQ